MVENHNQRTFSHVPLSFPVIVRSGDTIIEADRGMDLSAVGLTVRTDERLPIGSACSIQSRLSGDMHMDADGFVVREVEGGFAIQITEIGQSGFELLKNLIRYNAADPDLVEREFLAHVGLRSR